MKTYLDLQKRRLFKSALAAGGVVAAAKIAGFPIVSPANAQMLNTGIPADSVLAKIKKEGKLKIGYSLSMPWVYQDVANNKLGGIYYDVAVQLAKELEVTPTFIEKTYAESTVALRQGEYDLYAGSIFFTVPRGLVACFPRPLWHRGHLGIVHKDQADRFKSTADFNDPKVTFSVNLGTREEYVLKQLFPRSQISTVTGTITLAAEPVRTKKLDMWVTGDLDALIFAAKNPWAHVVDPDHPFGVAANTWMIRYGDSSWKDFLDGWSDYVTFSGFVQERYDYYKNMMLKT